MKRIEQGASPGNEAPQDFGTGFVGDVSAVPQTCSICKECIVDLLSALFELEPARAIAWAHVVQACFPWLREA